MLAENESKIEFECEFDYEFDYVVIGSGPGGQNSAIQAANAGKSVAIIDKEINVGGHCVYYGTIPSKTLREAALAINKLKNFSKLFDFKMREDLEVQTLLSRLDDVLSSHNELIKKQFAKNNIEVFHGRASFIDKNHIQLYKIDGSKLVLKAKYIVIASGSSPRVPNDMYVDHEHILDSDSILNLIYIPQSLLILGSGVIACEYASTFALLGTKVTILEKFDRPLAFMDKELTDIYVQELQSYGGEFRGNSIYKSVEWDGVSEVKIEIESNDEHKTRETLSAQKVLFALGRVANLDKLKLQNVNIEITDRNLIKVDENYKTNIDNIYAVGDVIGFPALASTSMEQGRLAVSHSLGIKIEKKFKELPIGIYAIPELASIGLTEEQASLDYDKIYVGRAFFSEVARAQISGINSGILKIITDIELNILGVHIIGEDASNLIHIGEMAILNNNKATIFIENIMNFPTMAEAYRIATLDLISKIKE